MQQTQTKAPLYQSSSSSAAASAEDKAAPQTSQQRSIERRRQQALDALLDLLPSDSPEDVRQLLREAWHGELLNLLRYGLTADDFEGWASSLPIEEVRRHAELYANAPKRRGSETLEERACKLLSAILRGFMEHRTATAGSGGESSGSGSKRSSGSVAGITGGASSSNALPPFLDASGCFHFPPHARTIAGQPLERKRARPRVSGRYDSNGPLQQAEIDASAADSHGTSSAAGYAASSAKRRVSIGAPSDELKTFGASGGGDVRASGAGDVMGGTGDEGAELDEAMADAVMQSDGSRWDERGGGGSSNVRWGSSGEDGGADCEDDDEAAASSSASRKRRSSDASEGRRLRRRFDSPGVLGNSSGDSPIVGDSSNPGNDELESDGGSSTYSGSDFGVEPFSQQSTFPQQRGCRCC